MEDITKEYPFEPFKNIGLAFSGGGFRAAAFSLGTLSYLEHLKNAGKSLTKNVSYISSTSGGTIANLLYSSAIHQGIEFNEFFKDSMAKLNGEDLLDYILSILNDDEEWEGEGKHRNRNLINALAKAYNFKLFGGLTMDVFSNKTHVEKFEVCCNASEFYRGLTFRFKTDGTKRPHQQTGNAFIQFDDAKIDTLRKIKLGDVLAASSCFPMGLEPIVYPEDFSYDKLNVAELREAIIYRDYNHKQWRLSDEPEQTINEKKEPNQISSFGLMDGGITDNQGLKSLMLKDKRTRENNKTRPFDLILVSDVTSYFMESYVQPRVNTELSWTKRNIKYYLKGFLWFSRNSKPIQNAIFWIALLGVIGVYLISGKLWAIISAFILGIFFTLYLGIRFLSNWRETKGLLKIKSKGGVIESLRRILPFVTFSDGIFNKLFDFLIDTKLAVLKAMLKSRVLSVVSMVMDVNLKQVRRLIYESFYEDSCWDNRRIPNFIYELSTYNKISRSFRFGNTEFLQWVPTNEDKALLIEGCEKLEFVAEKAREMGTTLWFDKADMEEGQLENIIMTGQFTTCMNLLEYVISLERKEILKSEDGLNDLKGIKAQLVSDIIKFKEDPGFLLKSIV
ncbi:patatin-like phospholipase family protein [Algoriphagus sp. PAP.12]|uniref:patatin-like phospholipase family protein n=1 Tax=Algoriphagus sp. PAP.12 TaxID=2996678 RepID=UPI00227AFBC0|nr:patatin-like phospholipase family protein [Algoriphagus sp. PAP.12]